MTGTITTQPVLIDGKELAADNDRDFFDAPDQPGAILQAELPGLADTAESRREFASAVNALSDGRDYIAADLGTRKVLWWADDFKNADKIEVGAKVQMGNESGEVIDVFDRKNEDNFWSKFLDLGNIFMNALWRVPVGLMGMAIGIPVGISAFVTRFDPIVFFAGLLWDGGRELAWSPFDGGFTAEQHEDEERSALLDWGLAQWRNPPKSG